MAIGRSSKCVIKGVPQQKVMPHGEFIDRIRKSLYFGGDTLCDDMEVSRPLAEYASELFSEPHKGHSLNRLNKVTAGSVNATPCSLIMALIYLDRLNSTDPSYVRRITPSELFIVSMMISTKFYSGHDEEVYLSDWAENGNMSEEKLKQLELEFLCSIDWNIYISNEQFFNKLTSIEKSLAQREGLKRGWLTYTELVQMLPWFTLAKFLLNNITVMAISYAASVMTIAGAFFLASQIPGNALHRIRRISGASCEIIKNQVDETNSLGGDVMPLIDVERERHQAISILTTSSTNATTITIQLSSENTICMPFNVEEELLLLEQEYRDEQYLVGKIMRKNEIDGPIYHLNANELKPRHPSPNHITDIHWYDYKDEYSDEIKGNGWINECSDNFTNCTKTLLWNLLVDTEKTFVGFSFVWFKLI